MEREILLLLGAGEVRESRDDGGVSTRFVDCKEGCFGENKGTSRDEGSREAAKAFAGRWKDGVEAGHSDETGNELKGYGSYNMG
jgi:hypothetical protein